MTRYRDILQIVLARSLWNWLWTGFNKKSQNFQKKKGLHITNRFSPGYCGWNVKEQHKLFQLLPPKFCGISLSDSALMIPIKSISGIIGMGDHVIVSDYPCDVCHEENCIYRSRKAV